MIEIKGLTFTYPLATKTSLQIDELTISEGECLVLCGPSGSGKTTFIRLLNGLIPEYYEGKAEGYCRLGDDLIGEKSVDTLSRYVGTVFQNPATQFFHNIVEHELVFPCENQCLLKELIQERLAETSQFFEIEHLLHRTLLTASGGERQRIAMATAMMQGPRLLVLDEPTANLDEVGIKQVVQHIKQLKKLGITVIIAEHRLDFLKELADRYLYIKDGHLDHVWSKSEWLAFDNDKRAELGLRGISLPLNLVQEPSNMVEEGLRISNLSLDRSDTVLGKIQSLTFPSNKVIGLIGPNGTGKTTFVQMIAGLSKATGEISLFGQTLTDLERLTVTSFVMQEVRLQLFSESVEKEIKLGLTSKQEKDFAEVVEELALTNLLDRHPMSLSGGEQQRVLIANSLLADKSIYIFDEPTSGLDYQQMTKVAALLQKLKQENRIVIVITHDKELMSRACDVLIDLSQVVS